MSSLHFAIPGNKEDAPTRRARLFVAALIACYGIGWLLGDRWLNPTLPTDFDQVWYAARALRLGLNPYQVIGPAGSWYRMPWPLYYPLPAIILIWPLSFVPLFLARCLFLGLSSALLAYGVTRRSWLPLLIFVSGSYMEAARLAQWSPLFAASLAMPLLSVCFPAKPSAAALCGPAVQWRRRQVAAVMVCWVALLITAWVILPTWLGDWLVTLHQTPHIRSMLVAPGGVLLLGAILRWRRPEGRLLFAYAVVPHNASAYEALPVLLVATSRPEFTLLGVGSVCAFILQTQVQWPLVMGSHFPVGNIFCVYLPALVMVLRRRNEGSVPEWLERWIAAAPAWVRGYRAASA